MVNLIRWLSLIVMFGGLYLLGRNSFHLKDAETFFLIVFSFSFLLTVVFVFSRAREKDSRSPLNEGKED